MATVTAQDPPAGNNPKTPVIDSRLSLVESRWLRFATFTAFYFAQGVPIGLLTVALPAWLGQQGRPLTEVAGYVAVVGLPWGIKLFVGPFMDRFTFLAMGFRRPWVLGAQAGLVLSLLAMAALGDLSSDSLLPLMTLGFVTNAFAATQDVAVDGMAIDVLPIEDRGRANAFMAFGQRIGFAVFGALTGTLLVVYGLAVAAIVSAVAVGVVFVLGVVVLERPGERRLPFSKGEAAAVGRAVEPGIFAYAASLLRVLFLPMSLLLIVVEFLNRVRDGFQLAVYPTFAVTEFGVTTDVYTQFMGGMDMVAAFAGVCIGPFLDRAGIKRFLLAALAVSASLHFAMAFFEGQWQNANVVVPLAVATAIAGQVIFIAIIAMFMNVCSPHIAATQFAIYMSLANLSRTVGATVLAVVGDDLGYQDNFMIMGGLLFAAALLLLGFREKPAAVIR